MAPGSCQGSLYETSVVLSTRETNVKIKKKSKKVQDIYLRPFHAVLIMRFSSGIIKSIQECDVRPPELLKG